jgi:hypothetical protein
MDSHDESELEQPRYPGEDTRVTSSKELWGWYSYGWAAEVFVICGIGKFRIVPYYLVLTISRLFHSYYP